MKKIITLLFCIGAFATSFAQSNHRQDGRYINSSYGSRNYDQHERNWRHFNRENIFSARERDFQIDKINHEFDLRVHAIECDPYLRRHERKKAIWNLNNERTRQIQSINEQFNCNR